MLVISCLGSGGAERVLSTMANWWALQGRAVTVVTLDEGGMPPFYELHPDVKRRALDLAQRSSGPWRALGNNLARVSRFRRALRRIGGGPIISFGTETNCLVLLASWGLGRRVIVSERCDPLIIPHVRAWRALRRWTYGHADAVVVQTAAAALFFPDAWPVRVIANPVSAPKPAIPGTQGDLALPDRPFAAAMGRLVPQKGFDLLVSAFSAVAATHPKWSLVVLGEGPDRKALEQLAGQHGLGERVHMPGVVSAPDNVLREAALFVLPSRFEGFPNALCEAMACGLAVIAADCPNGPGEIVTEGVDGVLVPPEDVESLARAMDRLMRDGEERRRLGARAVAITDRFSIENVMALWETALAPASGPRPDGFR